MQQLWGVPSRYYAIWIGSHPSNGDVFSRYITTDQSVYRALRTDSLSRGARFQSYQDAVTYTELAYEDVPPSVMYPELHHAPGPLSDWYDSNSHEQRSPPSRETLNGSPTWF